ncbi:MAG: radical SAM protein [Patescibacteria group bacterium]|nr:radical SAM protein [Patescibacteria group bacterium]
MDRIIRNFGGERSLEGEKPYAGVDAKVYPTYKCEGNCPFCLTEIRPKTREADTEQFLVNFSEEMRKYCEGGGRKVLFTGGEPTEAPDKLLGMLDELKKYQLDLVVLYTNGTNLLRSVELKDEKGVMLTLLKNHGLQNINMSVHHYERQKRLAISETVGKMDNENVFEAVRAEGINLRLNCTLMRDYIGSVGEVKRYIEWAVKCGIKDIYFRDLFHVENRNQRTTPGDKKKLSYTDDQRIDFNKLVADIQQDPDFEAKEQLSRHRDWGQTYIFLYKPTGIQVSFGTLVIGSERPDEATYFTINPNGKMTPNMNASEYSV